MSNNFNFKKESTPMKYEELQLKVVAFTEGDVLTASNGRQTNNTLVPGTVTPTNGTGGNP